jgi:hypothetical protein
MIPILCFLAGVVLVLLCVAIKVFEKSHRLEVIIAAKES